MQMIQSIVTATELSAL